MHDTMNKSELKSVRKDLRNNGTSAEATLWELIKGKQIDGLKFRWQHSVGPYILDFYCPQFRLSIELDGEVHSTSVAMDYADNRARFLINERIFGSFGLRIEWYLRILRKLWRRFERL